MILYGFYKSQPKLTTNKRKTPLNFPTDQWAPLVSGTKQRRAAQPGAHAMARLAGAGGARPEAAADGGPRGSLRGSRRRGGRGKACARAALGSGLARGGGGAGRRRGGGGTRATRRRRRSPFQAAAGPSDGGARRCKHQWS